MYGTVRGLTLGLVMLLGAMALTGLLATSLQHRAEDSQSTPENFSPVEGATVDPSGWPLDERKDGRVSDTGTERARSRQLSRSDPVRAS